MAWIHGNVFLLLCVIVCRIFLYTEGDKALFAGGMRTGPFDSRQQFQSVECFITVAPKSFIGLTLYRFQEKDFEVLMSLDYGTGECKTLKLGLLGSCSVGGNESTLASVKAVMDDHSEDGTQTYGCNATYYESKVLTETYTISVPPIPPIPDTTFLTATESASDWLDTTIQTATGTASEPLVSTANATPSGTIWNLTTVNSTTQMNSDDDEVVTVAGATFGTFVFTTAVVIILVCTVKRGRGRKWPDRHVNTDTPLQQHTDQRPAACATGLAVNYHEDYDEVLVNGNAACNRPLPRRPISVEGDYQEIQDTQVAVKGLGNATRAAAAAPTGEGPYAGIKEDEVLLEVIEETPEEKDPKLDAAADEYVPIRDITERKRRARLGKAKRATVI